jgi:hypothetical protein
MSSVVISGDTSGAITLSAPAVAGTNTITLPAATGTVMVSGNMPTFSAWPSAITAIADSTFTKLTWGTEDWDTNNNFSSSTFTPTVAGYYQINADMRYAGLMTATQNILSIYKNGSIWVRGATTGGTATYMYPAVSGIVYCNGSTDYIEIYAYQNSGSSQNNDNSNYYKFSGCLLRAA